MTRPAEWTITIRVPLDDWHGDTYDALDDAITIATVALSDELTDLAGASTVLVSDPHGNQAAV